MIGLVLLFRCSKVEGNTFQEIFEKSQKSEKVFVEAKRRLIDETSDDLRENFKGDENFFVTLFEALDTQTLIEFEWIRKVLAHSFLGIHKFSFG